MSLTPDPPGTAEERRVWIGEQLRVAPGAAADIAHRDTGWVGGPDYEDLTADELDDLEVDAPEKASNGAKRGRPKKRRTVREDSEAA